MGEIGIGQQQPLANQQVGAQSGVVSSKTSTQAARNPPASLGDHRPIGSRDGRKITADPPVSKPIKGGWWHSTRRKNRLDDTTTMLENAGALSKDESKWLQALKDNDKNSYNKLRGLLIVPKFWRPGQRGVWKREDRNSIRMQTLKAAAAAGLKASRDKAADFDAGSVTKALEEAKDVRELLNQKKIDGKTQPLYNLVSVRTLRDPALFRDEAKSALANASLASMLKSGGMHATITNQETVVTAAQALIDNHLLDAKAAGKLHDALKKNEKDTINTLMGVGAKVEQDDQRQKINSLMLLGLGWSSSEITKNTGTWVLKNVDRSSLPGGANGTSNSVESDRVEYEAYSDIDYDGSLQRPAYEWLDELPRDGSATKNLQKMWIAWAKRAGEEKPSKGIEDQVRRDPGPVDQKIDDGTADDDKADIDQ